MDQIKNVLFHIASIAHPRPSQQSQDEPSAEPQDKVTLSCEQPENPTKTSLKGRTEGRNPVAGSPEPAPELAAGPLKSPQFLGTEVEYFKEARRLLESAKPGDMLLLQMFEIESEVTNGDRGAAREAPAYEDQQALVPDLTEAAARGVNVEVILDSSKSPGSGDIRNKPVMNCLKKAARATGHLTADYYPSETVNLDHAKELVYLTPGGEGYRVEEALVGGSNWGNHTPANDDGGGTFFGPDALGAAQIFFRDQAFARGERQEPALPAGDSKAAVQWAVTSPHLEGGGSASIREAKLELTKQAAAVYLNEFCLTHADLVEATCEKGENAHARLDPNEQYVNAPALAKIREAGGQAEWANTTLDPRMSAQKNHQKLDVYVDASGVPFAATIGSANDTSNGLNGGHGPDHDIAASKSVRCNHEIDAVVRRYTSPDGAYSTNSFLDAALAKSKADLEHRSTHELANAEVQMVGAGDFWSKVL